MKPIPANALDKALAWVAPVYAAKRLRGRAAFNMMTGGYAGARRDRRALQNWHPEGGSADADLLPDLATLRERSRDLERNAPLAAGAIATAVTNVVGTGLIARPRVDRELLGLDETAADAWERAAARAFRLWADSDECDVTRAGDFFDLQELAFRATLVSGDVFVVKRWIEDPRRLFGYALQTVEADRVCNPRFTRDGQALGGGVTLAGGIERDRDGAPRAYHVLEAHPGGLEFAAASRVWTRLPAFTASGLRAVMHLYGKPRPDQARGVPYLAPVMESLKELDKYTEAERMAAVVAAMFTVFVKTESAEGVAPVTPSAETDASAADEDLKLGTGMVVDLKTGEDITVANPGRPNSDFDAFVMAILRQVASALEIPVEMIVKHFEASYSASRAALLEAWKFFRKRRQWLARRFCQPVYADVIAENVARGRLIAPGFFEDPVVRAAWLGCRWIGPAPGQLDPRNEAEAAKILVEEEFSTRDEITAQLTGGDWEENHAQRAKEERLRRADGLAPPPATAGALAPPTDNSDPDRRDREEQGAAA